MQKLALGVAVLFLVAATFWVGRHIDSWKHQLSGYRNAPALAAVPEKFPGMSASELVETALIAEKEGRWEEATDRYLEAKQKNLEFKGILFRLGEINFKRRKAEDSDRAFEQSIAFGEDLGASNFFRGRIALARHDLPAALRFFEEATTAEPFVSDFRYFWGEALREDHKPNEAIALFKQAKNRAANKQDETVCSFKIRLAQMEAGATEKVADDLAKVRSSGQMTVDWLLTAAALEIRQGHPDEAVRLLTEARGRNQATLYDSCITDVTFTEAAKKFPELARLSQP